MLGIICSLMYGYSLVFGYLSMNEWMCEPMWALVRVLIRACLCCHLLLIIFNTTFFLFFFACHSFSLSDSTHVAAAYRSNFVSLVLFGARKELFFFLKKCPVVGKRQTANGILLSIHCVTDDGCLNDFHTLF